MSAALGCLVSTRRIAILELDGVTVEMAREALRMKVHASEGRLNLEEMEAEFSWAQDVFRK